MSDKQLTTSAEGRQAVGGVWRSLAAFAKALGGEGPAGVSIAGASGVRALFRRWRSGPLARPRPLRGACGRWLTHPASTCSPRLTRRPDRAELVKLPEERLSLSVGRRNSAALPRARRTPAGCLLYKLKGNAPSASRRRGDHGGPGR
jgi:hypothetical protein